MLHLDCTDSTQDLARKMAESGSPEWTLVLADRQTRGRGRLKRKWASGRGGLYVSMILRPRISPARLGDLSLRAADAVARTLTGLTGLRTTVKPPNDVFATSLSLSGRGRPKWYKVCGILIEASGDSHRTDWVVIGIGVNVNNRTPGRLARARSLSQLAGRDLDLPEVSRAVLDTVRRATPWKN